MAEDHNLLIKLTLLSGMLLHFKVLYAHTGRVLPVSFTWQIFFKAKYDYNYLF
jgi:hypothetical protein